MDALDRRKLSPFVVYLLAGIVLLAAAVFWRGNIVRLFSPRPVPQSAASGRADMLAAIKKASLRSKADDAAAEFRSPEAEALLASPASAEKDDAALNLIRRLVAHSPIQTLAWTAKARDPAQGDKLYLMAVRAWAEREPEAALVWVRAQPPSSLGRKTTLAALAGMTAQPAKAVQLGADLLARDPDHAAEYGSALLENLTSAKEFMAAAWLSTLAPAEFRNDWTAAAFARWTAEQPRQAARALDLLPSPQPRARAFEAVVRGWASINPARLAEYSLTLPEGDERAYAMDTAMAAWRLRDPDSLGQWLNQRQMPVAESDAAKAALATQTDGANRPASVALQWAESISDPALRFQSVERTLGELAQDDFQTARYYAENASWLNQNQRRELLLSLGLDPSAELLDSNNGNEPAPAGQGGAAP
jgi:hypothetical protein